MLVDYPERPVDGAVRRARSADQLQSDGRLRHAPRLPPLPADADLRAAPAQPPLHPPAARSSTNVDILTDVRNRAARADARFHAARRPVPFAGQRRRRADATRTSGSMRRSHLSRGITLPIGGRVRLHAVRHPRSDRKPSDTVAQRPLRARRVLLGHTRADGDAAHRACAAWLHLLSQRGMERGHARRRPVHVEPLSASSPRRSSRRSSHW